MSKLSELIEEVCGDMCDNYCKYRENCNNDDDEFDEHCDNCPLHRIN